MARVQSYVWQQGDLSGIANLQSSITGASLVLNGTYGQQVYPWNNSASLSGFQRTVVITSANDLSGATVTILGTSWSGLATSTSLAGPNANSVSASTQFMTVTSIAGNATLTGISAGWGTVGESRPFTANSFNNPGPILMQCSVSGTISYSARSTLDDIQIAGVKTWIAHPVVAGTTTLQGSYSSPPAAIQIAVASSTLTGAALTFRINPSGK